MINNKIYKIFALIIGLSALIAFIFGMAKIGYYSSIRELYKEDYFLIQGYCTTFILNIITCILFIFYNKNKILKIISLIAIFLNIVANCFSFIFFINESITMFNHTIVFFDKFSFVFESLIYLIITLSLFVLFLYLIIEIINKDIVI